MVKLIRYNDTYFRLVSFNNEILKKSDYKAVRKHNLHFYDDVELTFTDHQEIERISLSRSKNNIKSICLSNDFEYFMTVTVNSSKADRFSLSETQEKMKKICHKIKRKNKDFKFIFITEKHQDGAFHFHGMCKNIDLYINNNGYFSNIDFDMLGFNSFDKIKDYNKCCNYITKYITKNCIKNDNNQIYFCSRGLNRGESEYFVDMNLRNIFGDNIFENEYCQVKDFDFNTLSMKQQNDLINYFKLSNEILSDSNNIITNWLQLFTNIKINVIK